MLTLVGAMLIAALPLARFSPVAASIGVVQSFGGANDSLEPVADRVSGLRDGGR